MEPKWDSVWDMLSGALPVFLACTSLPEYNLQLLLLCGSCIYFYTVSAVDTLCAGGPFILPCLKGTWWYSWLIFLHLSYYSAKVHTVLSLNVLKIGFFCVCVSIGQRIKDDVLLLWLLSLGIFFIDTSLWDNIVKVRPHFIHIIWAFCLYWTAYRVIDGEGERGV